MTRPLLLLLLCAAGCGTSRWDVPAEVVPRVDPFASSLAVTPIELRAANISTPADVDEDLAERGAGKDLPDALRKGIEARLLKSGGFAATKGPAIAVRVELPLLRHDRRVNPLLCTSPFVLFVPIVYEQFEAKAKFHAATPDGEGEATFEYDVPYMMWSSGLLWNSVESPGWVIGTRLVDAFVRDLARAAHDWPSPGEYRVPRPTRAALIGAVLRDERAEVTRLLLDEARRSDRAPGEVAAAVTAPPQGAVPAASLFLLAARRGSRGAFEELMSRVRGCDLARLEPDGQPTVSALERSQVAWAAQRARAESEGRGKADEQVAKLRALVRGDGGDDAVATRDAQAEASAHLALARALITARDPVPARVEATRAIELDPTRGEALVVRATAHDQMGDVTAAEADYAAAEPVLRPDQTQWRAVVERRLAVLRKGR